jgi:hypothetical protein
MIKIEHYRQMCKEKQNELSERYGNKYTQHASYKEYLQKLWVSIVNIHTYIFRLSTNYI